jgi:uncharacterized alkaline shock family protein YloU
MASESDRPGAPKPKPEGSAVVSESPAPPGGRVAARRGEVTELESSRGSTTIADAVVEKVAGIAAREVPGVWELGGGTSRAVGAVTDRVGLGDERSRGVSVEVGEKEAAIDVVVVVEYGESIPRVAAALRENVIKRIEGICGLSVVEVNISVNDLHFPGDEDRESRVS